MKHLEDALGHQQIQNNKNHVYHPRQKHRPQPQKWTLDPDLLLESAIEAKQRLTLGISDLLQKQFQCQKYLQEEAFRDLLHDLGTFFPQCTSELEQLIKIEQAILGMSQSCPAQLKNYIKHFQSLLDAKIRKLKKRGKRAELVEYDRLLAGEAVPPRRNQVYFINEDDRTAPKRHLRESRQDSSRRSFGTMNSLTGSNQNESGGSGGNNQSGSGSKSGEANALSVLLANIDAKEERKGRQKEKQQETYQFTTIINATLNVRQRNTSSRTPPPDPSPAEQEQDKDEAFIFHRPKQHRHKI